MDNQERLSSFTVNKEKCVGCALCVPPCPMKILKIIDDLCVITDETKCLECGSCRDKCPERAIIVASEDTSIKTDVIETDKNHSKTVRNPDTNFIPIVKHLRNIIFSDLKPVQIFDYKGKDIQEINKFTLDKNPCFVQLYNTDKIDKIAASSINFFGDMTAEVVCITPAAEYDLPYYMMDWDESKDHIFFFCDVVPSDDIIVNNSHLDEYFYKPLEDLYLEYSFNINGLTKSPFHWVRAIHSPYTITGTIDKKDKKSLDLIFDCAEKYLQAWIKLWQNAEPLDPSSEIFKRITLRREVIGKLYHENDPGGGAIAKFLGEQKGNKVITAMIP
jgi:NAD-dependent dihydropyrimidine dehydrogenase PreA subunit